MKEATFDEPITSAFIQFWGTHGALQYFPSFARPFFVVDVPGRFILKGIEGNSTARIVISKSNQEANERAFCGTVADYNKPL